MDKKKICFIMCTNNRQYREEAVYYINRLSIPDGYSAHVVTVEGAEGMAAGYNAAMKSSDAKYKIYLHQDVLILHQDFIRKMLEIFADPGIGMFGMAGAPQMAVNGVWWNGRAVGKLLSNTVFEYGEEAFDEIEGDYAEVEAVDGFLMATQYDLEWREDLFKKWHFYDASQSFEFRKRGYRVVVPRMEEPWCLHDSGINDFRDYYGERKLFVREYM